MPDRHRDVSRLTAGELERTQRDLRTSLALTTPGSRSRAAILAHLSAIDAELAERAVGEKDQLPAPRGPARTAPPARSRGRRRTPLVVPVVRARHVSK